MKVTAQLANDWFDSTFTNTPVMAILRGLGSERSLEISQIAWELGITVVELPLQSEEDAKALRDVASAAAERGFPVGAGTITRPELVRAARDAGAAFTVSPGLDPVVVRASWASGMPSLPGVASATEVQLATEMGLNWLKAFPASTLGPAWLSAMRGPFPAVSFVATGGVDSANAASFLAVGARVVAVGSALERADQLPGLAGLLSRYVRAGGLTPSSARANLPRDNVVSIGDLP
ncbi:bifunctional 4-hydroxy-2-oxoglutarate aldolase/2-dehydro-3-deoxy-phosphogluconate aldolase [uncultured Schumannella sp.]|uniref:bifunctional 4-hydroxy-2-oxoglutarate aldolase/2-dehydro-3-deoxy-phosphogluconate aldolase n=1 Tax=uncultured Schumannella sp. TaxID=1195956 RepID=UPI0025DC2A6D|nr:bifunctional 4-hydroxy-2-oxoglutarate aldolase/2-dehydro-3-deoxy-phosphogluconate aldolase [uncultured Schumannella sp.]